MQNNNIEELKSVLPTIPSIVHNLRKESAHSLCGPCPICGQGDDRFVYRRDTQKCWTRSCDCIPENNPWDTIDFHCWKDSTDIKGLMGKYLPGLSKEHAAPGKQYISGPEYKKAVIEAQNMWGEARPANPEHPYLIKKRIEPHGIKQLNNKLIIPVRDVSEDIVSLQEISQDGSKMFLSGGKISGNFFIIPGDDSKIFICEGFATGATIHEATGNTVIVAFNSGNLKPVSEIFKK